MAKYRFKKLRLWATYPFAGLYLLFAYKYGISLRPGIWLIIIGLLVRFWAAGYIKKIRKLTTSGPYSFVRNPLYVGNFLIGLGFCLFVDNLLLSLIYIIMFFFFYIGTMKKEESILTDLFGKDYIEYKNKVPAFLPRLYPYIHRQHMRYSLRQAHYNGELIRVLATGIVLCVLYFAYYFFKEKNLDINDIWRAGLLVSVQGFLLWITIIHRKKFIKQQDEKNKIK